MTAPAPLPSISLALSPSGNLALLSQDADGNPFLWELRPDTEVATLRRILAFRQRKAESEAGATTQATWRFAQLAGLLDNFPLARKIPMGVSADHKTLTTPLNPEDLDL